MAPSGSAHALLSWLGVATSGIAWVGAAVMALFEAYEHQRYPYAAMLETLREYGQARLAARASACPACASGRC